MRTSTFNYIKDILADYPRIDEYIKKREEELRYPHRETDLNGDIKGTKASYDNHTNMMITIEQDRRLVLLERNKRVVEKILNESDVDTVMIINELYIKKYPRYTIAGLVDNKLVFCSRRKAYNLRNNFFEEIAKELNLEL